MCHQRHVQSLIEARFSKDVDTLPASQLVSPLRLRIRRRRKQLHFITREVTREFSQASKVERVVPKALANYVRLRVTDILRLRRSQKRVNTFLQIFLNFYVGDRNCCVWNQGAGVGSCPAVSGRSNNGIRFHCSGLANSRRIPLRYPAGTATQLHELGRCPSLEIECCAFAKHIRALRPYHAASPRVSSSSTATVWL